MNCENCGKCENCLKKNPVVKEQMKQLAHLTMIATKLEEADKLLYEISKMGTFDSKELLFIKDEIFNAQGVVCDKKHKLFKYIERNY